MEINLQTLIFIGMLAGIVTIVGFVLIANQRLNRKIQEDKENLELIFNTSPDAVVITRLSDGVFLKVNEGFSKIFGYTINEVYGRTTLEANIWENREERKKVLDLIREKGFCENFEAGFRRKDGKLCNGLLSAKIIYVKGKPQIIGVIRDITRRKLVEEALVESEEKYRLLIENSYDIIYTLDKEGIFKFVSPSWTILLGHSLEQVIGQSFHIFVHSEDISACMEMLKKVVETGERQDGIEYRVKHIDGTWRWHTSSATTIKDKSGVIKGFEGIARDITEQKQIKYELLVAKKQAEMTNQAKSEFLSNMSHEMRTPMNGIIGFTEILKEMVKDEESLELLNIIDYSSKHLLNLINDILDLAKIEAGKLEIHKSSLQLPKFVKSVEKLFEQQAMIKKIDFIIEYDKNLPDVILTDEMAILKILNNLIGNSIKFTEEGWVKLIIRKVEPLQVTVQDKNAKLEYIEFSVIDTGIGINEEKQKRLFEPFEQGEYYLTKTYGGTGLGLAIVKNLVELLEGDIKVETQIGKGTQISVTLPFENLNIIEKRGLD